MDSLYEKLKEIEKLLEQANIKSLEEKEKADLEKLKKEKEEIEEFVSKIKNEIIEKIENGKIPFIKIESHDRKTWIQNAGNGKAKYNSIWNDMVLFFKNNRIKVVIKDEHDGMGMKSWITITVEVIKQGYRGGPSSETHGQKFDLDVGEYRG
jgi:hypothetical protein